MKDTIHQQSQWCRNPLSMCFHPVGFKCLCCFLTLDIGGRFSAAFWLPAIVCVLEDKWAKPIVSHFQTGDWFRWTQTHICLTQEFNDEIWLSPKALVHVGDWIATAAEKKRRKWKWYRKDKVLLRSRDVDASLSRWLLEIMPNTNEAASGNTQTTNET